MTNTLSMNLSNVKEGALKEVYDAVEEAFKTLGREIKKIIDGNENLLNRVRAILVDKIERQENSPFVRRMADETDSNVAEVMDWIRGLQKGIEI